MAQERNNKNLLESHAKYWASEAEMAEGNPQLMLERGEHGALPPLLVLQGTNDDNVPSDMASNFVSAWRKAGGVATLNVFEGQVHAFVNRDPKSDASVQALESSGGGAGRLWRHVLVTRRSAATPGFARTVVELDRFGADGRLAGAMRLDLGVRVKTGQRFAAVTTAGEVLVIGAADRSDFTLQSCRFPDGPGQVRAVCERAPNAVADGARTSAAAQAIGGLAAGFQDGRNGPRMRWADAFWFAAQTYRVNAAGLGDDCRRPVACRLGPALPLAWQPLTELRFARGDYLKRGVPYAQNDLSGRPLPGRPLTGWMAGTASVRKSAGGRTYLVGDIENSSARDHPEKVTIFGIDCSALVSALWGRKPEEALDTAGFIALANRGYYAGVGGMDRLRSGDALVINLRDRLNHIAVFREARPAGPLDSSRAVLVFESNSSCGGVCWSFYDESFFDGWAMIRKAPDPSGRRPWRPIPTTAEAWSQLMAGGG